MHFIPNTQKEKTDLSHHRQQLLLVAPTVARASVGERVAQVCYFLLGLERRLPAGVWPIHRQLVEAVGLEDLRGGVGGGLVAPRRAAVARLPHEVDAAVDGAVGQHGARLLHGGGRQDVWGGRQDDEDEGSAEG